MTDETHNVVYKHVEHPLTPKEYLDILNDVDADTKAQTHPPILPKPGHLFLLNLEKGKEQDYKADQYQWLNKHHKHLPKADPIITCSYFYSTTAKSFSKRVITKYNNGNDKIVIHYLGSLVGLELKPHGNRKFHKEIQHVRTAKSVIDEQKSKLMVMPQKIYREQMQRSVPPTLAPVLQPRDRKQVENTTTREKEHKLPSKDDIVGIFILTRELPSFIQHITLHKNFAMILCEENSIAYFSSLIQNYSTILSYDTTFQLGDFYVSCLSFKHPLFETEPVIPLAYLVHDRKLKAVHKLFFNQIHEMCPEIDGVPIVTDRELAINIAIKEELPKSANFYCWNHILQDIEFQLKKFKNITSADYKIHVNHTWDLLDSNSHDEFLEKYETISSHWSKEFKKYFDGNIYEAITSTGKWVLLQHNRYTIRSGITNNAAESYNRVLKRCMDRREVNLQVLVLTLYSLDCYYKDEIVRGSCNLGNYKYKPEYITLLKKPAEVNYEKPILPLDDLPYAFINKEFTKPLNDEEAPCTNYSIAKMLIMKGCIRHLPEESAFLVTSLKKEGPKNVVRIFPSEDCTCQLKKNCHHIKAVKLSLGIEEQSAKYAKITTMMKKKRGFRSGRKGKPEDVIVVESAVDSENKADNKSILVPTVAGKNEIVKYRFSTTQGQILNTLKEDAMEIGEENVNDEDGNKSILDFATGGIVASTPKKARSDSPTISTFEKNFLENKEFIVFGRSIYPTNLDCLKIEKGRPTENFYLTDAIFDVFIPCMINEEREHVNNVLIYSAEVYPLNYPRVVNGVLTIDVEVGFANFLRNNIGEKDIVFFPCTYRKHCTLFIVIKKKRMIIYLDSLLGEPDALHINYIARLYSMYDCYMGDERKQFCLYVPKDIPVQEDSFNCGLFTILYCATVLKGDINDIRSLFEDLGSLRLSIYRKMKEYMELPLPRPTQKKYALDICKRVTIETKYEMEMYSRSDERCIEGDTMVFLSNLTKNFWEETSTTCFLNTTKCASGGQMIFCEKGSHWIHRECANLKKGRLPKYYVCDKCQSCGHP